MKKSNHSVKHAGKTIPFTLLRKKVKNVNLRVRPDATVVVSAGSKVPFKYVEGVVKKKASWIIEALAHYSEQQNKINQRQYNTGELITFLGQNYPLQVVVVKKQEEVIIDQGQCYLFIKDENDFKSKECLITEWQKEQARPLFEQSLDRVHPLVAERGITKPSITVRKMKTRWGSCSWGRNKITLNSELVKAPEACLDYVVLHELAHFKYRKHDQLFYNFLTEIMPDWKDRRKLLKGIISVI
ncbi:MAG: M48 family metallopeptidase [Bacillota bacterium]